VKKLEVSDARANSLAHRLSEEKVAPRHSVHSLHRYFGKLIPGIPRFAIKQFSDKGSVVLDPFCGSGTTLVEAMLEGRRGMGVDVNPLATFITKVKTTPISRNELDRGLTEILWSWRARPALEDGGPIPYVVNIDHWFRPEVKLQLISLKASIMQMPVSDTRDFFLAVFSAFIRSVSNADPQHVFPGYSKRMRALDAAGRLIDVEASFLRAARKRILQISSLEPNSIRPKALHGSLEDQSIDDSSIDLVVTNPPYISSIRYLETMKIEMGWLDMIESQSHYLRMDRQVTGTERFYKDELVSIQRTGIKSVDEISDLLFPENPKMAMTVSEYFRRMQITFSRLSRLIRPGGHLVIKISDTKVRGQVIHTPDIFVEICQGLGFSLVEKFVDEFDKNSRSLLTARNTYSGLMTFDYVLVLKR